MFRFHVWKEGAEPGTTWVLRLHDKGVVGVILQQSQMHHGEWSRGDSSSRN